MNASVEHLRAVVECWDVAGAWRDQAACAKAVASGDAEIADWFPPRGGAVDRAVAVCASCPVRLECLQYAVSHFEREGIWGGLAARPRRKFARKRTKENIA